MSRFQRAKRIGVPMKLGISGVSGSGKTYSAIRLAHGLTGGNPDKILHVDTENESAALYGDLNGGFLHDVIRPPFTPRAYIDRIRAAVQDGLEVVILDSVTHGWEYILSYKEELDRKGGNSYTNWGKAKPLFRELRDALLQSPIHVICCMRAKADYAIEETEQSGNKRATVKKLGTAPIVEPGFEYEFSVMWSLDRDTNLASVEKDRTNLFQGRVETITEAHGQRIIDWLGLEPGAALKAGDEWGAIAERETSEFAAAQADAQRVKGEQWPRISEEEKGQLWQYAESLGIPRDNERAVESLRQVCELGRIPMMHALQRAKAEGITSAESLYSMIGGVAPTVAAPQSEPAEPPASAAEQERPTRKRRTKESAPAPVAAPEMAFEITATEGSRFRARCKLVGVDPEAVMEAVWAEGGRTYADLNAKVEALA